MCEKRGYPSKRAARQAVRTMGSSVRVYWCADCRQYHTTKDRGQDRAMPRIRRQ
jgi:hypothetical protein